MGRRFKFYRWILVSAMLISVAMTPMSVASLDISTALQVFGVAYAVDMFGDGLNEFINTVTFNRGFSQDEATKVVPIISIGNGTYIGAAQVAGPSRQVQQVQAVGRLEADLLDSNIRADVFIPLDSKNPFSGVRRVSQVGVSAILDLAVQGTQPERGPIAPTPVPVNPAPTPVPAVPVQPPVATPVVPRPPEVVYPQPHLPEIPAVPIPSDPALRYAVFAGDDIELSGNNGYISGDIHANDNVLFRGNNSVITGRIEAHGSIEGYWPAGQQKNVFGTKGVNKLDLPTPAWKSGTFSVSKVYHGDTTFGPNSRLSGVVQIDGDLVLDGWFAGGGVLKVAGDVRISGRGITSDSALVIWAEGNVTVSDSRTRIDALIVSEGDIRISGSNVEVNGGLIAEDDVILSGNDIRIYR